MTGGADPALVAAIADVADDIQRAATDAVNEQMDRALACGACPDVIRAGILSGVTTLLYSVITSQFPLEHRATVFGDVVAQIATGIARDLLAAFSQVGETLQ